MNTATALYDASIAPSSRRSYESAIRHWIRFTLSNNLPTYCDCTPKKQLHLLAQFILHLTLPPMAISGNSCDTYVAAVAWFHARRRIFLPTKHPYIRSLLKGAKRLSHTKHMEPLTAHRLRSFCATPTGRTVTSGPWSEPKRAWTALLLIWNLLLRVHEALPGPDLQGIPLSAVRFVWDHPPRSQSASHKLSVPDKIPDRLVVNIQRSKTDQLARGYVLSADHTGSPLCTVTYSYLYWRKYHSSPGAPGNPFLQEDKQNLSRLISSIKNTLRLPGVFNTHSLRSGAATSLALAGAPIDTIKRMGRWHSSCFQQYVRVAPTVPQNSPWSHTTSVSAQMQKAPFGYQHSPGHQVTPSVARPPTERRNRAVAHHVTRKSTLHDRVRRERDAEQAYFEEYLKF